jgi:hypothetical protein
VAADKAVLNNVNKKKKSQKIPIFKTCFEMLIHVQVKDSKVHGGKKL